MAIALAHRSPSSDGHAAPPDRLESLLDVGRGPVQLALKPDGGEVFVSNSLSDSVSEVYRHHRRRRRRLPHGRRPRPRPRLCRQFPALRRQLRSQEVTVYSIDDGKRLPDAQGGSIHVGDGPSALAFSAEGHLLLVVDSRSSDIAVIRTASNSLFTILPTGRAPNAIAVKAFRLP